MRHGLLRTNLCCNTCLLETSSLSNRGAVNIGDEFGIYVLPIKGTSLTVSCQSQGSEDVILADVS